MQLISSLPLWKRNYYLYQVANFISLFGDFLGSMALHWWVLERSEGMTELSSIFLVANIIRLISLPLFGPIADQYCRKNLLNLADIISCLLCIVLALFIYNGNTNFLLLCILMGFLAISGSLFRAASFGMIPELVPPEEIPWAISQNQIALTISIILGGAIGSLFISIMGIFWTIIFNAGAIAIAVMLLRKIDLSEAVITKKSQPIKIQKWGLDFIQGLEFIAAEKGLLSWLLIIILLNALLVSFDLLLPYYVQKVLLADVWQLGLVKASIGVGSVIGALLFSWQSVNKNVLRTISSALAIIAFAIGFFGMIQDITVLLLFGIMLGVGEVLFFIPLRTKMALMLPHHFRSRIGVIFAFGQQVGAPLSISLTALMIKSVAISTILIFLSTLIFIIIPIVIYLPSYAKKELKIPLVPRDDGALG